jgi:2-succinyl-6-hydroxy-2,4-cyclohexadiene-1-carboxylate synthase
VSETIVLLHGFSGTHRGWDDVVSLLDPKRYRPLALDLPGHGERVGDRWPITFKACVEAVLDAAPDRFALCGYSMGGRVALHVALAAPERVSRLTVIAANPGIEDLKERAERLAADERLAQRLESEPFEDFIESWRTQPLFADDPLAVGEMARADQRRNDPLALAAVMRGLSVGAMASLWGQLGELEMPVRFVVGTRDEKFRSIGGRFAAECPACTLSVVRGGHGLPLENPEAVAASVD